MPEREPPLLIPDWNPRPRVHACVTTRLGGASKAPFDSFNLGLHVGDDAADVQANRRRLLALLRQRSGSPDLDVQWLQQVHGSDVHCIQTAVVRSPPEADALYTRAAGIALAVLTADCLPVLFCSADGREIAVAHAGWRGLAGGILERTVACFDAGPRELQAWLGPAIASCHFEVGPEVRARFLATAAPDMLADTAAAFRAVGRDKFHADLYRLARLRLRALGLPLAQVGGQPRCTVCASDQWYSYRQERQTGRFATLIMRSADPLG